MAAEWTQWSELVVPAEKERKDSNCPVGPDSIVPSLLKQMHAEAAQARFSHWKGSVEKTSKQTLLRSASAFLRAGSSSLTAGGALDTQCLASMVFCA